MTTRRQIQKAREALQSGDPAQAIEILERALERVPDNLPARWLLVECLDRQGDFSGVARQIAHYLHHAGPSLDAINRAANHLLQSGRSLEAVFEAFRAYQARRPDSANAVFNHAYYLGKDGQAQAAVDMYQRALQLGVEGPEEAHLNIANLAMDQLGDPSLAREHLERALAIRPDFVAAHYNLGNLAEQLGDRADAQRHFERCLALDPHSESALARLADAHRFETPDDPLLGRLEQALGPTSGSALHFAIGRAREQLADYEAAWRHFEQANARDRDSQPPYRPRETEELFRRIAAQCDAGWLARYAGDSHRPVFICGMFRTGSTLLERALSAHPSFAAGGESEFFPRLVARALPAYPDDLERVTEDQLAAWRADHAGLCRQYDVGRLTDKRPDNFLYAGLIRAVLPAAQFIVTERDWRDVATSIFSNQLGPRQNYATALRDIRHYLWLHGRLVDHWSALFGNDLIRVRYEDLVTRPREALGYVLQRLGEEWDENCMAFDRLGGAVRTASVWQVREPVHARSVGRWRNYRAAFVDAFGAEPGPDPAPMA